MTSGLVVGQLVHGYSRGHELLGASQALPDEDADLAAQLSDLSGMPVDERTPPYLTFYPLPSGTHYAVAGTWADDEAPRDGCVLTRTLLVPMADWLSGSSARALAASLRKPRSPPRETSGRPTRLAPVEIGHVGSRPEGAEVPSSPEFRELLVAYFGRGRRPSVWLDGPPDGALASLLLDFIWPSLRRDIAVCTYALKPRSISGRHFDVQFAPRSAVRRFSKVPERNIVGLSGRPFAAPSAREARLASRIVGELAAIDAHGTARRWDDYERLRAGLPPNPDAPMRLVVLDELREKAEGSATTAVAVLDALAAVVPAVDDGLDDKGAALEAALVQASTQGTAFAVELLGAIADRCSKKAFRRFSGQRRRIIDQISRLAALDPLACLFTVSRTRGRPLSLMTGVAAGLAVGDGDGALHLDRLEAVRPDAVDTLLRLRPDLVALYLRVHGVLDPADGEAGTTVLAWLRRSTAARRRTLAKAIAKSFTALVPMSVLAEVIPDLGRTDRRYVLSVALDAATSGVEGGMVDAFWSMLDRMAVGYPLEVRDAVSTSGIASSRMARLWASTYADPAEAFGDLPAFDAATPCARPLALAALFDLRGHDLLGSRLVTGAATWVADILRNRCTRGSREVLRFLCAMLEVGDCNELVLHLSPRDCEVDALDAWDAHTSDLLGARLLESLLATFCSGLVDRACLRNWLRAGIGAGILSSLRTSSAIAGWEMARRHTDGREAWALRVWQSLGETAGALRGRREEVVVDLVDWAFGRTAGAWDPAMTSLWVSIVEACRDDGEGARIGAVEAHAVDTAMTHGRLPLSALLVTSFPRLYRAVEYDQPALPLLAMWFPDWDKAKQLRKRLVSVFLASDWPAGDLALAASGAGILDRIVSRLRRKGHGAYLDAMVTDLRRRGESRAPDVAAKIETVRYQASLGWD